MKRKNILKGGYVYSTSKELDNESSIISASPRSRTKSKTRTKSSATDSSAYKTKSKKNKSYKKKYLATRKHKLNNV